MTTTGRVGRFIGWTTILQLRVRGGNGAEGCRLANGALGGGLIWLSALGTLCLFLCIRWLGRQTRPPGALARALAARSGQKMNEPKALPPGLGPPPSFSLPTFNPRAPSPMNRTQRCLATLALLILTAAVRGESPLNPPKEKWPTSAGGPEQPQDLKIKNLPVGKLVVLGNSITAHGPAPGIGWTGDWGMAASAADKDFVHVLAARLGKAAGGQVKFMARNIADFERGHADYDIAAGMKDELALKPDVVVVAIGENVPELATDEAKAKYAAAFGRLLSTLEANSHPAIFVRSQFWANPTKDEIMKRVSAEHGVTFIDAGALGREPANAARSERKIDHDGVAGHPGDRGMQALADAIFAAIERQAAR